MGKSLGALKSAKWRKENPEKSKEFAHKYYNERKDYYRSYQKEWRKNNDNYVGGNKKDYINTKHGWIIYKLSSIRQSAKKRKIEVTITYEDLEPLVVDYCPVTGLKLNYGLLGSKNKILPESPSVDRINNDLGYIQGNIIIVSSLVNRIKTNLSINELPTILNNIISFYEKYSIKK